MFSKVAIALVLLAVSSAASANHECIAGWHQVYPVLTCESSRDHTKPAVAKPTAPPPRDTKPPAGKPPIPTPPPIAKSPVTYLPPPPVTKPPLTAPELDPSSTLAGVTMLMGALAVFRGRRRSPGK